MNKILVTILLFLVVTCFLTPLCFAEEAEATGKGSNVFYYGMAALASVVGVGLGALGCGIGQGIATSKACEGIARNPGTTGKIQVNMIIGLAMIESLTIYALVIALILLFVNPFKALLQ